VKISGAAPNGGMIVVNRANGKAGVILGCAPQFGSVIVQDAKGQIIGSLPAPPPDS